MSDNKQEIVTFSKLLGKSFTVRDVLPLLKDACLDGVDDFFHSIEPQKEGQHPLDRELVVNKRSCKRVGWVLLNLQDGALANKLYEHFLPIRDGLKFLSIPLQQTDSLYPTMLYMMNSVGNSTISPKTVDFSSADEFCSAAFEDRELEFTRQFAILDVFGLIVEVPQYITCVNYDAHVCDSDLGEFSFGETEYKFWCSSGSRLGLFECDGRRHNVAKFYSKMFFKHRAKVEREIAKIQNKQSQANGGVK